MDTVIDFKDRYNTAQDQILNLETRLKEWETYKTQWSDVVNSYQEEQDRLMAQQLFGANFEEEILNKRMDILTSFKDQYNSVLSQIGNIQDKISQAENQQPPNFGNIGGGSDNNDYGGGGGGNSSGGRFDPDLDYHALMEEYARQGAPWDEIERLNEERNNKIDAGYGNGNDKFSKDEVKDIINNAKGYAGGTKSASGGISLVGEAGAELRVLNKGDGIISNGLTENLMQWGRSSPSDFMQSIRHPIATSTLAQSSGNSNVFHIGTLKLDNVQSPQDLINKLMLISKNR